MRILEVVHGFPPAAQAGAEIYAHAHAHAMLRHCGEDVVVLTRESDPRRPEYAVRDETSEGLRVIHINNTFRATRTFADTYRNDRLGAAADRIIEELKPDVAHLHHLTGLSTTIVASLAARNIPSFYTLHDYWLMCHRGQLLDLDYRVCEGPDACDRCLGPIAGAPQALVSAGGALRRVEAMLPDAAAGRLRRASRSVAGAVSAPGEGERQARARLDHTRAICSQVTRFLAPSKYMRQRFLEFGIPSDRLVRHDYGFDHSAYRQAARTTASHLRFGFLGSLMVSKGPDVLLEAFNRLPGGTASLTLYGPHVAYHGDESCRPRLEALMSNPAVRLAGPLDHGRVPPALAGIDVLVVPSIWPENSPLVIREAFLAGVAVIASRIGGIPEIVEDGVNGFLFNPGDVADLHRLMLRLVETPSLLAALTSRPPAVRTIQDDVEVARGFYREELGRRKRLGEKRLAAIVLNYRTPDETLLTVKSLLSSRRPLDEIVVVDNSDNGDCSDALAGVDSSVSCVVSGRNLGFSGGMNAGIRAVLARGADAVLLVNSDVIVPPDCAGILERQLDRPGTGIVGPVLRSRSDPRRITSLGMKYSASTGRMRHVGAGESVLPLIESGSRAVDAISGCVMLVRRAVFEKIGLLPEDYFFSFEDLDFCLKARDAGYATVLAADATAYHEGSRSIGADSSRRLYFAARNHLLVASRRSPSTDPLEQMGRALWIVTLNLGHAMVSRGGTRWGRLAAVARGTRDHMLGRYGDRT